MHSSPATDDIVDHRILTFSISVAVHPYLALRLKYVPKKLVVNRKAV